MPRGAALRTEASSRVAARPPGALADAVARMLARREAVLEGEQGGLTDKGKGGGKQVRPLVSRG